MFCFCEGVCSASEINGTEEFNLIDYCESHEKYNGSYYYNQAYANVTITGSGTCYVTVRLFKNGALRAPRTTPVSAPQTCTCYSDTLQGTGATFGNVTFS